VKQFDWLRETERCIRSFNVYKDAILSERCRVSNHPCLHRALWVYFCDFFPGSSPVEVGNGVLDHQGGA
jgi:hypothetical protein